MIEKSTNLPKTIAKFALWAILALLLINFGLGLLGNGIENLFKKFDIFGFGENWRESVSTDNGLKGQTNGGLTIEEIKEFETLAENKPYHEDVFRNSIVIESENYVTIYRQIEGTEDFYNLNFVKTNRGIVYDGAIGVQTKVPVNIITGKRNFQKAKTTLDLRLSTYNIKERNFGQKLLTWGLNYSKIGNGKNQLENIVTFSDFQWGFAPGYSNTNWIADLVSKKNANILLFDYITEYLAKNVVYKQFQSITDDLNNIFVELKSGVENIDNPEVVKNRLNTFANYLWQSAKSVDGTEKETIIDVSEYFGNFIPEDIQRNYPLVGNDISKFNGFTYYPMYENKTYFDTVYMTTKNEPKRDQNKIKNDNDINKDKNNIESFEPQEKVYSRLKINLNNKNNSQLTNINIKDNPVLITIGNKKVLFDSLAKINTGQEIAIQTGGNYYWTVESNLLMFNSYSGTMPIDSEKIIKTFDFEYNHGYINTVVNIQAVSNADKDKINLSKYPVKVVLNGRNNEGTYQFVFDSNEKLDIEINQLVKQGAYNYSILSEQLIFGTTSGTIEIDSTVRRHTFHYAVSSDTENKLDIKLNALLLEKDKPTSSDAFVGPKQYSNIDSEIIRYIGGENNSSYIRTLRIYDSSEKLIFTKNIDTVSGSVDFNNVLQNNNTYVAQLTFSATGSEKIVVSTPASFIYNANKFLHLQYE